MFFKFALKLFRDRTVFGLKCFKQAIDFLRGCSKFFLRKLQLLQDCLLFCF